jgi:carbon starvation protein CstA
MTRLSRMTRRCRDDTGNAIVSLVFFMSAIIIGGVLASIAVSIIAQSSYTAVQVSMTTAADQRFDAYTAELNSTAAPNVGSECYPNLHVCVSVDSVADTTTQRVVTLKSVYGDGKDTAATKRILTITAVTHISGYDSEGNPVWVNVSGGVSPFTAYGR